MVNNRRIRLNSSLACALMAAIMAVGIVAQTPARRPGLVVGIVVEGLSEDNLELLKGYFGEGGFRRLMEQGVVLTDVDYGEDVDATASTAILMTGTSPSVNGIPSTYVYDPVKRLTQSAFLDEKAMGNFTDETYSPAALMVSTLADEVRIDAAGTGMVHAIAAEPDKAIALAGHAANSAVWINDLNGKWATTTYYKELPQAVSIRNYSKPLSMTLDTASWSPSMKLADYPDLPDHKRLYPFTHTFPRNDKNRYRAFKSSPLGNRAVTDLATDYISTLHLGGRGMIDMLNLAYTLVPYRYGRESDTRTETMDSYLRLDRDLARLFRTLDSKAGRDNYIVFLASTPAPSNSKRDDEKWNIPHGEFSAKKAISLLNMYLIALHGNGDWVAGYHNRHFYLNHQLAKSVNVDIAKVREESAEFLARMAGVSNVYTIDDIVAGRAGDNALSLKRNTSLKHAGDLLVTINPGWETIDDDFDSEAHVVREGYTPGIAFIMAPTLSHRIIETPVDARSLAPGIARLIRIRAPNGAATAPLRLR